MFIESSAQIAALLLLLFLAWRWNGQCLFAPKSDRNRRVRRMARHDEPKSFDIRMGQFLENVQQGEAVQSRQKLYVHEDVDPQSGRPPKPQSLIRRILEHIRALVHGSAAA